MNYLAPHYDSKPPAVVKEKCYIINDKDLFKFSNTEIQFLKWIQSWESRIFMGSSRFIQVNTKCYYICNVDRMYQMDIYLKSYQETNSKVIGQDQFVWTAFANALIKKHKKHTDSNGPCTTKVCLFLLVWSSYFLLLPNLNLVQEALREILHCTRSLKFLFSFLPGMSMTSYISNFVSEKCDENVLCDEFFIGIDEDVPSTQFNLSLYHAYAPLIFYIVKNLTSLHSAGWESHVEDKCRSLDYTLVSILDKAIVNESKCTILTLAVQNRDEDLVKLLLQIGASANVERWDPVTENYINAEHMLITSVNSLVASKYFFASLEDGMHPTVQCVMDRIESVTVYGNMLRRSLLYPSSRKADNMWRGLSWRHELNSEIADKWGVDYDRPFPSLKHIAKITIRHHILKMDRKLLIEAVLELPLPNLLKSYLNLNLD